ncbi:complement C1q-like protein 2 [Scomber scombrus]|uniref:complement C1q-like protein 2 n=1 Tax=Scomber scombrus TaxID=13677 RepID=UPI002DD9772B|nr:complement C1q-like protein 2 [Scomber scombrus]
MLQKRTDGLEADVNSLKKENEDLQMRLNATNEETDKGKKSAGNAAPKIAFSTSLSNSGFIYGGPSNVNLKLVFKRVISNIGNGYNPDTGIFTASVKGLYYFTFTTVGCKSYDIRAMLMKNGAHQVSTNDHRSTDSTDSSSNAAALPLDAGDKVHVQLSANSRVFDNRNGYTTFSGFLLFSM